MCWKKRRHNRDGMRTGTQVKRGLRKENGRNRQKKEYDINWEADWNTD
jgi:hypothetical protein